MPGDTQLREASADPRLSGGRLTIDLEALAWNYRNLARMAPAAEIAGVVKADAYGIGMELVAPVLWREGCRSFFVALPEEGLALRSTLPEADIYVLSGLFSSESASAYRQAQLIPVLNDAVDISLWEAFGWDADDGPRPCAIHVDTGMNRLGLTASEYAGFIKENALTGATTPRLLISHMACADDPTHSLNQRQRESFQAVVGLSAGIDSSLANSAGLALGPDVHFDMVRPGIALYGGMRHKPFETLRPVVTAEARIAQVREAKAGETVSYGASHTLNRDTILAIAAVGYADGLLRSASGAGVPLRDARPDGGCGFVAGCRVPIIGRMTMDLTVFDVTELGPGAVSHGDWIELFGPNIAIEDAARRAGTISYELLTSLGRRYHRRIVGSGAAGTAHG